MARSQVYVRHPAEEILSLLHVGREASLGVERGARAGSGWGAGAFPNAWGQSHFLSLRGLCQGGTHGLDKPMPSRNKMVSGPDELTSSICPGSQQEQTPAPRLALLLLLFALVDLL